MTIAPKYTGDPARPLSRGGGPLRRLFTGHQSSKDRMWVAELRAHEQLEMREVWRLCCESIQALRVDTETVSGLTIGTPLVRKICFDGLDGPPVLLVELRPGMVIGDITEHAARFAAAFGCRTMRAEPTGLEHPVGTVRVRFIVGPDPLDSPFAPSVLLGADAHAPQVADTRDRVVLALDETGRMVSGDVVAWPHCLVTGATTSGKTSGVRFVLMQLCGRPDVEVVGSDPSGSLWRPWAPHSARVTGLADVEAHAAMLESEVAEMDLRLANLPPDADRHTTSVDLPLRLVVLEEYPGLLRSADNVSKACGVAVRASVSRLLAEGHKAGFRLWLLAQRADAQVLGGFERSNLGMRITFATDRDGIKMAHPAVPDDVLTAHVSALPGVALLSGAGVDLCRVRFPLLPYGGPGGYAQGCRPPGLPSLIK